MKIFLILCALCTLAPVTSAYAYTSRPTTAQVLQDFQQALKPKLEEHQGQSENPVPNLPTQAIYFENPNGQKNANNQNNRQHSLIVIQSGIHGIETYAGSFMQQVFLTDYFQKFWQQGHSILLVHAYNGWGFLNHRRFTESGVDLNRNNDTSSELFQTKNEKYTYARKYLERKGQVTHPKLDIFFLTFHFIWANLKEKWFGHFSTDDFREALGNGQYEYPTEIGFGGRDFEPQTLWAQKRLAEIFKKYQKILVLDFHTGLGVKGQLHMILSGRESKDETKKINELFKRGVANKDYEINDGDSEGFYFTNGDYLSFVRKLNPDAKVIAMAAEYGTMGIFLLEQIQTVNRLLLENQGHWNGYKNDEAKTYTQSLLLDLFAPNETDWWNSVEQKGRALFDDSLTALGEDW